MKINRPLSPHLTIYKPQLTSSLSIFHRITGAFLASMLLLTIFVIKVCDLSLSIYPAYWFVFTIINNSSLNWILFAFILLFLLAFSYHMSNGIRHLIWDLGFGLDLSKVYLSGYMMLCSAALIATVTTAWFIWLVR